MTIPSWKVLDVSSDRKTVRLVPSAPTTAVVKLSGAQGYNNAVKLLNYACDALYGGVAGSSDGITARSISMVDLEGTAGDGSNGLMSADTSKITSAKTGTPAYGEKYTASSGYEMSRSDGTDGNTAGAYIRDKTYPVIYEEEALREIDNVPSSTGLGMSDARSEFITRANSGVFKKTATSSIRPTKTFYLLNSSDFKAALGTTNAGLILPNCSKIPGAWVYPSYWVASRCLFLGSTGCNFDVRRVSGGNLSGGDLFKASDEARSVAYGLFPVVSLSSGVLSGADHAYTFTPAS